MKLFMEDNEVRTHTPVFEYEGAGSSNYVGKRSRMYVKVNNPNRIINLVPSRYRPILKACVVSSSTLGYIDFIVSNIGEALREKEQIVETLNDSFVAYYFGQHPAVLQVSGFLEESIEHNEYLWFRVLYDYVLRGTKAAQLGIHVNLYVLDWVYKGVLNSFQMGKSSNIYDIRTFSFTMLLTSKPKFVGKIENYPSSTTAGENSDRIFSNETLSKSHLLNPDLEAVRNEG